MKFWMHCKRWAVWMISVVVGVSTVACAEPSNPYAGLNQEESARYESARLHTELGAAYYSSGQIGVALQELTLATLVFPRYAPAFYMLGLVHMDLKEDQAAEQAFQKAISLDPDSSEAYNNYGWFLCQRDRIDEALKQFMTALKNPRYETPDKAYVNAGICSRKRQDDVSALDYFERALKIRPNHPQALFHLADIQFQKGDFAASKSYLIRYMKNANPSADALWLGVRVERKLGDQPAQASYAQMLRQRHPESRETQLLKAEHYE